MKVLHILLLLSVNMFGMEYQLMRTVSAPGTDACDVLANQSGYYVLKNGQLDAIPAHNVEPRLRNLNLAQLQAYAQQAKLKISMNDAREYIVRSASDLHGGGWLTGVAAGIVVRAAGYGAYGYAVLNSGGKMIIYADKVTGAIEATAKSAEIIGTVIPWLP